MTETSRSTVTQASRKLAAAITEAIEAYNLGSLEDEVLEDFVVVAALSRIEDGELMFSYVNLDRPGMSPHAANGLLHGALHPEMHED